MQTAGSTSPLSQNPHKKSKRKEKNLEVAIGREVKALRKQQGITVAELSSTTRLSLGMGTMHNFVLGRSLYASLPS